MKKENLLKKKFYIFDETEKKYFEGFGSKKGKKVTYFSNSPYSYPFGYMTEKKCEEVLLRIIEIREKYGKTDHEYSIKDFQEYERTYWIFERDSYAVASSNAVTLKIKDLATTEISTDNLECALYHEQN